jgi:long-chain acyl-CoA synthetase
VKELSIVGVPDGAGETVACLVRCEDESKAAKDLGPKGVRERVVEHVRNVSLKLPLYKRVKVLHFSDAELPKTATRKVKRKLVVEELLKLERLTRQGEAARKTAHAGDDRGWIHDVLAAVSNKPRAQIHAAARLQELGFDSLMYTELGVALEAAGVAVPENADLTGVATVEDFEKLVLAWGLSAKKRKAVKKAQPNEVSGEADEIRIPKPVVSLGRSALTWAQRMTYERLFHTRVTGRAYLPRSASFLVAANHTSHLDMGLVKHALGDWGPHLVALAAKDYFFEDPLKRAYFENFTNLVPMDRHGSLRESLRLASEVMKQGYILLIFPEGTRSTTGVMIDFKPSLGYLALTNKFDVLPMYLDGTHDALPKGSLVPKNRDIAAHIGPLVSYAELRRATDGMSRSESYREASRLVELAVRRLAPKDSVNRVAPAPTASARVAATSVMVTDTPSMVASAIVREPEDA